MTKISSITGSSIDPSPDTDTEPPPPVNVPDVLPGVNALACSGDPGAMLAALTMESARDQEKSARAQRDEASEAQEKADAAEIQDMHDKADRQRTQGVVDGLLQGAQGLADMASGFETASGNTRGAAGFKGLGAAAGASKSVADGMFSGAITDIDASAKAHDVAAESFKKMADDAHDDEKDAKDLSNKALDFYKEYTETKNQTALAATHRA